MEFLVPEGRFVAAPMAGGIILAAAHDLGPQAQAAVGVALPWEPPHTQVAGLNQVHLQQHNTKFSSHVVRSKQAHLGQQHSILQGILHSITT